MLTCTQLTGIQSMRGWGSLSLSIWSSERASNALHCQNRWSTGSIR